MDKSEELTLADLRVTGTVTLLHAKHSIGFLGTPLTIVSICDPFVIVEYDSKTGKDYRVTLDSREVIFGTLSLDYIEAYNA
jgi:hypothetical protein